MKTFHLKYPQVMLRSVVALMFIGLIPVSAGFGWEVDFSRRLEFSKIQDQNNLDSTSSFRGPASVDRNTATKSIGESSFVEQILEGSGPAQDLVILNTEDGFVPSMIQVRKNGTYRVVVVNVHPKEKNVSFVMDAFTQHHNTYFGMPRSFLLNPKVDGVFSFQCPETGAQGKWVVLPEAKTRKMASEAK